MQDPSPFFHYYVICVKFDDENPPLHVPKMGGKLLGEKFYGFRL